MKFIEDLKLLVSTKNPKSLHNFLKKIDKEKLKDNFIFDEGILSWVTQENKVISVPAKEGGSDFVLCVPIVAGERAVGILQIKLDKNKEILTNIKKIRSKG